MLENINKYVLGIAVPLFILAFGVFFLIHLRFFFILKIKKVFGVIFSKKNNESGISPFKAMTVALAGTLGVGNIVGVSGAILLGGYGSVFWMWVSAFVAMILKYAEIVLAMLHRRRDSYLKNKGGAMYYIQDCFGNQRLGRVLGIAFAVLCVINSVGMGCMLQVNAVREAFDGVFGIPAYVTGILMAVLVAVVVINNIHDISGLTVIVIPAMTFFYIILSGVIIFIYRENVGAAFIAIFKGAFGQNSGNANGAKSIIAGVMGYLLSGAVRYGTMRGLLSNEAGCGTAPMAHASSGSSHAAEQGVWGILEVFVDTIFLCTLTALVIILVFGGQDISSYLGRETSLVFDAFGFGLGKGFEAFAKTGLAVSVFFFAFATIICWGYYGVNSLLYIFPGTLTERLYKAVYIVCVFVGAFRINDFVWQISDFSLGCMTVINLIVLFIMRDEVKKETSNFLMRIQ